MRFATWNVNSVRKRLDGLRRFLKGVEPDIVCLQELKCVEQDFPTLELLGEGYRAEVIGQKAYNGVAVLSRAAARETVRGLPGDAADEQARYLEAVFDGAHGPFRVVSLYLPNGNPAGTEKYAYKLKWMERLEQRAAELLETEVPFVLAGDFNVIPGRADAADPAAWETDALFLPEVRNAFRRLLNRGFLDVAAARFSGASGFTFWDYQGAARARNNGIRIDHLLASPAMADRLTGVAIHAETRDWPEPSDHVPVVAEFDV
ncbi:MAG: exodeoxyribonuclease III [Methylobacteriaceae bacterium]|jgi:exodeoxyribonuclease-3|nr:exodeoxyribonuclease III [Methylobacteriaceae bacterium]